MRLMRVGELPEHGRDEQQVDEVGIELRPSAVRDLHRGPFRTPGTAIVAAIRDDIEGVGDRDEARIERDASPPQTAWVAASVPSLVVGDDALSELRVEGREWREHFRAAQGMRQDGASLARGQLLGIVDDVEERLVNLSDVVKERDPLERAQLAVPQAGGVAKDQRVAGDSPDMLPGLMVIGLDGIEECLERGRRESLGALPASALQTPERAADEGAHERGVRSHHVVNRKKWGQTTRGPPHGSATGLGNGAPATAYSPAVSRPEYHRRCQA